MDGFYRGIETSLLAFTLLLAAGAFASFSDPRPPQSRTEVAVTLPMIAVSATR